MYRHYGDQYGVSLKLKLELQYGPGISVLGIAIENHESKRYTHPQFDCSTIILSQDNLNVLNNLNVHQQREMDEEDVVHRILLWNTPYIIP